MSFPKAAWSNAFRHDFRLHRFRRLCAAPETLTIFRARFSKLTLRMIEWRRRGEINKKT